MSITEEIVEPASGVQSGGLSSLLTPPDAVLQAATVIQGLDECLLVGFGRLGGEHAAALDSLTRAVAGTPWDQPLTNALSALKANEFQPQHFAVLAAVRAAIQGARYDALLAQASAALGRNDRSQAGNTTPSAAPASGKNVLCDSARQWLMELAITGFKQLDASTLAPFSATLENLYANPALGRLACLLTGFQQELLVALPIGHASSLPVYRWADLWMAAMISTLRSEQGGDGDSVISSKVSGTLSVLGVDLRQHAYFISAVVYAALEAAQESPQIVRITLSSYKVDALNGKEVWRSLVGEDASNLPLLQAISEHRALKVKGMSLLSSGDLIWNGEAELGKPLDVLATASRFLSPGARALFPLTSPIDRHPVQLAEPLILENLAIERPKSGPMQALLDDGTRLPIAESRLGLSPELTADDLTAADGLIGLLRFDANRWMIQPLYVHLAKKKDGRTDAFLGSDAHQVATKKPKKGEPNTLAILQERASRLLRKKS